MRQYVFAAVAAVTLGMTGTALAATASAPAYQQAGNSSVLPSQRPVYLADNSSVLPSQRPAYLA